MDKQDLELLKNIEKCFRGEAHITSASDEVVFYNGVSENPDGTATVVTLKPDNLTGEFAIEITIRGQESNSYVTIEIKWVNDGVRPYKMFVEGAKYLAMCYMLDRAMDRLQDLFDELNIRLYRS